MEQAPWTSLVPRSIDRKWREYENRGEDQSESDGDYVHCALFA